jgi:signal peptidase I
MTENVSRNSVRYWVSQGIQLFIALLVVFTIRSSIVEPFKIPSGSMIPTLYVGDFIFVNKLAYGIRLPFTEYFDSPVTLIKRDPPKRGEIIVFRFPRDTSVHYIKRVVGTPGDKILIRDKVLYINGEAQKSLEVPNEEKEKILKEVGDSRYGSEHIKMYREDLSQHDHFMMTDNNNMNKDFDEFTVPEDRLFVMGDNRDFSNDSRYWGFVPYDNVAGRAVFIWLSMWINLSDPAQTSFKPGRIGTVLK